MTGSAAPNADPKPSRPVPFWAVLPVGLAVYAQFWLLPARQGMPTLMAYAAAALGFYLLDRLGVFASTVPSYPDGLIPGDVPQFQPAGYFRLALGILLIGASLAGYWWLLKNY